MWRGFVLESTHSIFEIEGESLEYCDQQAETHFQSLSAEFGSVIEGLGLYRIDAPAVAEKITFLCKNHRQEDGRDWSAFTEFPSNLRDLIS